MFQHTNENFCRLLKTQVALLSQRGCAICFMPVSILYLAEIHLKCTLLLAWAEFGLEVWRAGLHLFASPSLPPLPLLSLPLASSPFPPPLLRSRPLKSSEGSGGAFPSGVWGEALAEIAFGAF